MAITPLEQFGSIGRTQDFSIMKHQENAKETGNQIIIHNQIEKDTENKLSQVRNADHSELLNKKFDAKEKGENQYHGDGGRNKQKQNEKQPDGKVILKGNGFFDMKI